MADDPTAPPAPAGKIAPILPLTLLETVRSQDLPGEILENEDLPASLPRRFGLSEVVARQIQRYQQAARRGEKIGVGEVTDLLRLVLRRPDAEAVLRETGRTLARRHFERVSAARRKLLRILPQRLLFGAVRRSARRLLRPLVGAARLQMPGRPLVARMTGTVTAAADGTGRACSLYSGALEELASLYTRQEIAVRHTLCSARGDAVCEWKVVESGS